MIRNYGYDLMDGQQVPQLVIDHDHVLTDHAGTVHAGARLAGSLANNGTVIVRGVFGGARSGRGTFRVERTGHVKQPSRAEDGSLYYDWSSDD
jgi:cytoskeletal protein CcmA (bactofilin family)